jgi:pyridoxine kinase
MSPKPLPRVLAIHDLCVFGRCSLSVISPVLSARGVQCCPLPAAILSAPANYEGNTVFSLTENLPSVLRHLTSIKPRFDAIYSGFLSDEEQAAFVTEVFGAFPDALRVVDPVLGDRGKLYRGITDGMSSAMYSLAQKAHIITPNVTEAAILLGKPPSELPNNEKTAAAWLNTLSQAGPGSVVLTGILCGKPDEMLVGWTEQNNIGFLSHPIIKGGFHGTGDLFTAYLLAELLYGAPLGTAAKSAAEFAADCCALTAERGMDGKEGVLFEGVLRGRG